MTFLVADGVVPSNEDRGYVLRRIIRRAVRFAYMLDVEQLVMPPMVERCIEIMGDAYPELVEQRALVLELIAREEERFRQTLARGSALLDTELDGRARRRRSSTAGSPSSCTTPSGSRSRSPRRWPTSAASRSTSPASRSPWRDSVSAPGPPAGGPASPPARRSTPSGRCSREHGPTEFTGRDELESTATVLAVVGDAVLPGPHPLLRRVRRPGR